MSPDKVLSRFTFPIRLSDDVVALWNSMWLRVVFVVNPMAEYVEKWKKGSTAADLSSKLPPVLQQNFNALFPILENEMFLVEEGSDDVKLREVQNTIDTLPIAIMYLILAGSCNLRCPGCYLGQVIYGEKQGSFGKLMSKETVKDSLDLFKTVVEAHEVLNPEIVLYGGEPLLNKAGLKFAVEYAKQQMPDCTITLNTNATLVDLEIAELLKRNDVGVAVSIDGPKEIHDLNRPDALGNGSFDRTLEGFFTLQKHGVRVSISCTMLPTNVDTIVETSRWFINDLGVTGMDLNLFLGSFTAAKSLNTYATSATEVLIESYKIARDHNVCLDRVTRKLNPFVEGRLVFNGCGACGQQIVISPDGSIGTCQAGMNNDKYFVHTNGKLFDPTNNELWKEWRQRSPFNMDACLSCEVLGICGGGCPYNAELNTGSLMGLDEAHCVFAKSVLRFFLQELWEETNKQ